MSATTPAAEAATPAAPAAPAAAAPEAAAPAANAPEAEANMFVSFLGTTLGKSIVCLAIALIAMFGALNAPIASYHGTQCSLLELQGFQNDFKLRKNGVEIEQTGGWLGIPVYFGKPRVTLVKLTDSDDPETAREVVLFNAKSK